MKISHPPLSQTCGFNKQDLQRLLQETKTTQTPKKEQEEFDKAEICHICNKVFNSKEPTKFKVRDHCHFTGKYRGCSTQLLQSPMSKTNDSSSYIS